MTNRPVGQIDVSTLLAAIKSARTQCRAGAGTVLDVLLRMQLGSPAQLADALQAHAGVMMPADIAQATPVFTALDPATAKAMRCVLAAPRNPVSSGEVVQEWLAAADPWDPEMLKASFARLGRQVMPVPVTEELLARWLGAAQQPVLGAEAGPVNLPLQADGPIVAFVDSALKAGYQNGASDIHFECDRTGATVKLRLDGVMTHFARLEGALAAQEVVSRVKVLAQLDITERRLPQDGRFRYRSAGQDIDLRVSIMPSVFGEDAVLRLLDKAQLRAKDVAISLDALGFEAGNAQLIRELAAEPSGMLLVTGPTGSGKTTTLYAVLSEINTGLEKIVTIEDPVEYELAGVLQIPVNERKGLTFAKGLRSILRHDPDRILVGEIRDAETAEIAVQSSLTGHLVFTTVHANSVADIMGRFRHFGLDMFGFMSSLNGVVVQRLVRRLCPHCSESRAVNDKERVWLSTMGQPSLSEVPVALGCSLCRNTGYMGRFVLAEVHQVDDELRDQVIEGAPVTVLKRHGHARGVIPLAAQAAKQVSERMTTLEEVRRVVGWL